MMETIWAAARSSGGKNNWLQSWDPWMKHADDWISADLNMPLTSALLRGCLVFLHWQIWQFMSTVPVIRIGCGMSLNQRSTQLMQIIHIEKYRRHAAIIELPNHARRHWNWNNSKLFYTNFNEQLRLLFSVHCLVIYLTKYLCHYVIPTIKGLCMCLVNDVVVKRESYKIPPSINR